LLHPKGLFMLSRSLLAALLLFFAFPLAYAQDQSPGPAAHAQCKFPDGKNVTVDYLSPGTNGRRIFGDAVPYGQVWQTGDGQPPALVANTNLMLGGKNVPAGNYTIFTIPDPHKWTLIINKKTGKLDLPYEYESSELARIDLLVRPINSTVENFTIALDQRRGGCVLSLRWENTEASVLVAEEQ
jgi:hypothetical protein